MIWSGGPLLHDGVSLVFLFMLVFMEVELSYDKRIRGLSWNEVSDNNRMIEMITTRMNR